MGVVDPGVAIARERDDPAHERGVQSVRGRTSMVAVRERGRVEIGCHEARLQSPHRAVREAEQERGLGDRESPRDDPAQDQSPLALLHQ